MIRSRSPDAPREVVDHGTAARQGSEKLTPEEFQRVVREADGSVFACC